MPRPKRPPPGFPADPRHPRRRTASAPASASAPSPGGGAAGAAGGGAGCYDLSRAFGRCRALLDDLLRHDDGWVFEAPVDALALGLRDYYTVVADPMDLGTVLRRLERRRYVYPTAFADDVRLTFRNALSYNNQGDPVYESAAELSGIFEARWASIEAELPHPLPPDDEHMARLNDKLPRLPVAGVPEKRDVRLPKEKGKMAVNLSKADAAALDELDRLVPQHGAAHADVNSPMQAGELPVTALRRNKIGFRLNRHEARVFASMGSMTDAKLESLASKGDSWFYLMCTSCFLFPV